MQRHLLPCRDVGSVGEGATTHYVTVESAATEVTTVMKVDVVSTRTGSLRLQFKSLRNQIKMPR